MGKDDADISELVEKAKIVAEATGRDEQDVLADLLDDGVVNRSNHESGKDLVTQLKEAAELITTVQAINQEVSENTVLNGGENTTEVKVETTLEGDLVDRAIQSIQRKSENLKKLIVTMMPLFLLLTGGGLEAIGIIDLYSDESSNGSNGGCESLWAYDDYSWGDSDTFHVAFSFFDESECGEELDGHFIIYIFRDGEDSNFDAIHHNVGHFIDRISVEVEINDLENGYYWLHYEFHVVECEDGSCEHGVDEWKSPHKPAFSIEREECAPHTELDEPMLTSNGNDLVVDLVFSDMGGCGQDIEIKMEIWNGGQLHDDLDYGEVHNGVFWIEPEGDSTMRVQGKAQLSDLPDGDSWTVKARYSHANADDAPYESGWRESNSIVIDEVDDNIYGCTDSEATNYDSMATSNDGSCEYPPETCEINLFNINLFTNDTLGRATVAFDLDCGYDTNDLEGYNVSVQFLIYHLNETNSGANGSGPLEWATQLYYIEGYADDVRTLSLDNFTVNNTTHYDFYWYAVWEDADGNQQFIERTWLNREI